ncbi:carboxymuconolactone decarboxylase family protein [Caldimonas sp. KR1-144]|uniref:carboxymuconolactone decarboxylase family protein n=1 Tax=Caldimonas sp. KR1-144 TaxID=3400911 RepID=UPI003C00C01B
MRIALTSGTCRPTTRSPRPRRPSSTPRAAKPGTRHPTSRRGSRPARRRRSLGRRIGTGRRRAPDLAQLAIDFAYRKIYSRPGLDLAQRQLVTLSALAAMGGLEPQLRFHVAGALNAGWSPRQLCCGRPSKNAASRPRTRNLRLAIPTRPA